VSQELQEFRSGRMGGLIVVLGGKRGHLGLGDKRAAEAERKVS
jgi:hypothetical protein